MLAKTHLGLVAVLAASLGLVACDATSSSRGFEPVDPNAGKEPVIPAERVEEPARLVRGERLVGLEVVDVDDVAVGTVRALWFEPDRRDVVGVAVRTEDGGGLILAYELLDWVDGPSPGARLRIRCSQSELPGCTHDAELFAVQETMSVSGEIVEVPGDDAPISSVLLKVHDEANLLHRVLVEPSYLDERVATELVVGRTVRATGVFTRDETGKLLVADEISWDGGGLDLRDGKGAIRWGPLARPYRSTAQLMELPVSVGDGSELQKLDWLLDWRAGTLEGLVIEVEVEVVPVGEGVLEPEVERSERVVPLARIDWVEETGSWRAKVAREGLHELDPIAAFSVAP